MSTYSSDRRSLLKIIGAIGATCAYPFAGDELLGQTTESHRHEEDSTRKVARFLNDRDFEAISRMSELIIPKTDTPGSIGAGVPDYIDFVLARNTDQQLLVADGLRWLDSEAARAAVGTTFVGLAEDQQLSILQTLCDAADSIPPYHDPRQMARVPRNVQFFALIKGLTADGYYTSRIGLIDELGYKGNKVRADFPGCSGRPTPES
jgi:hypothetical protein